MGEAARTIDRIDASPAFTAEDAERLNGRFAGMETQDMLRTVLNDGSLGRVGVVSSFGTEAVVLLHLIARANRHLPVIFVDTLKMFPETLAYRQDVVDCLGFTDASIVRPDPAPLAERDAKGMRWSFDPDGCCAIRKVEPMERAKAGLDSWISGRKAFQSHTRQNLPLFELEGGRLKVNPLGSWTKEQVDRWFAEHDLPRHPLEAKGYPSIGCQPCTSTVLPGENPRAGRWRGWDKVECGIHNAPGTNGDRSVDDGALPPGYEPFL